ncbi:bifunctional phosphoribosylaminoimidazolecarboxamide formyltransferase/IMP cyclohydrolase [candidate division WOR-1 bacterium RIFOXYA12_FULL_43_27]|uniref:Bifunctional purine biosynthesis protein PurH n=1 Tax=candidate division WOR-1 bacterium RIFOXYC2_FULL_46_14 TaxID=1802587 RepID=A0A1F4U3X8_UNCSA|nr:MAG: bifunctional phosphoribosylaminoimidazolecarboxamide formyltransferase/IMP cyclohydrolase [candidate division WOR-1 bacterium RIFOXYA12_FULL_43_27]OGC20917.1 MAG: bifunctional phosphoribosylaminoimidazolecarboxamide formyltransferase/IMP cyclohydrolase [candidate division WOR-1 bacterium RIFOXYB2_FULL_46_45]OGC32323.1 MAG: bifunctional phosphoribosylaminoimidazolecarboxamide formyltransferase/IMP cyclohydrolase [candidate division WOR-1 bacterium RIFOXYA2_FULL_46_56]OGC39622.1 MAG: bifun
MALISVYDKRGLLRLAKGLIKFGYDLVSSGGTAEALKKAGVKAVEVSKLTRYPHMLGGRVKTLHPIIHGGILANRSLEDHLKDMAKFKIKPIDIVVCNLYPFEDTVAKPDCTYEQAIEKIDIGGPTMVRAAAKNHKDVAVVIDPNDYPKILEELKLHKGVITAKMKKELAVKAFRHTQHYDTAICKYLEGIGAGIGIGGGFPVRINLELEKIQDLRYGENPHQKAAFYKDIKVGSGLTHAKQLHGKELSFNNIVDMDAAWAAANYFSNPTIAIIKHTNPCGSAQANTLLEAYKLALASDPVSAFGGIIAANRKIDSATAEEIAKLFVEVVIAPGFDKKALTILTQKKNIRLVEVGAGEKVFEYDYKKISGGFVVQEPDAAQLGINEIKTVTEKEPNLGQMEDLFFAWGVAKHVKSNAIILVKNGATVGVGAGQMSRIDSCEIAVKKAGADKARGSVLASDAFFPFPDVVEFAAKHGISAIIQPGGSVNDQKSIDSANQHGIAMVFTGRRHFKH